MVDSSAFIFTPRLVAVFGFGAVFGLSATSAHAEWRMFVGIVCRSLRERARRVLSGCR
jgi:hypothetical protein